MPSPHKEVDFTSRAVVRTGWSRSKVEMFAANSTEWAAKAVSSARALLTDGLVACGPSITFGLRLWASVCLALYVAFWLELDDPVWAGTTAAIVCQPRLGASLRKGWFRMIGTPVGAIAIVALTACLPQNRALFLISLALWAAACTFVSTILRNFAAYSAALSGYTAVIIASDQLGATGGLNGQAFMLAVIRVSEIGIGIVSAGIVLAGTDFGGARQRLATHFAGLTTGILSNFAETLAQAGAELPDTQPVRREFIRRVIDLDPVIDETLGESSQIRYHSPVLQRAADGLFTALSGWRAIANHLVSLPDDQARAEAATVLQCLPQKLLSLLEHADPAHWIADPTGLRRMCEAAIGNLVGVRANTPSQCLLADKTAEALMGISNALRGLSLLVADPARPSLHHNSVFRLRVPDWLPALVNAGRTFIMIGAVALFWIVTAWPNGAGAMAWVAIPVILFAPRADQAYDSAIGFTMGTCLAAVFAAIVNFAVLPGLETFAAFSIAIGFYLVPAGALVTQPRQKAMFAAMASYFVPLLGPLNQMNYDTVQFYNAALAIVAGAGSAALSFSLVPPLSPAFRTERLLALTLRDLRRLAMGRRNNDWEGHVHARLSAMPDEATPLQRAHLLAAMSVGSEIIRLRHIACRLDLDGDLESVLAAVAEGKCMATTTRLMRFDAVLAHHAVPELEVVRGRSSILTISEALTKHAAYFDSEARR